MIISKNALKVAILIVLCYNDIGMNFIRLRRLGKMFQSVLSKRFLTIKYLFFLVCILKPGIFTSKESHKAKIFTIMLDPSGDAQYAGRQIDDCLERGISLQFVEKVKDAIMTQLDGLKIAITRFPGERLQPLQNANFSNRLDADFYLSFHFYKEKEVRPRVYLFLFSYSDDFITKKHDLYFYSYDEAHLINIDITKMYARKIRDCFQKDSYKKMFDFKGICKIPFKPLIGVKAPAIALEIGLKEKDDWKQYISVLVDVIAHVSQG